MPPTLTLEVVSQEYEAAVLYIHCMQALEQGPFEQRADCKGKAQGSYPPV